MFGYPSDSKAVLDALNRSLAIIEFDLNGKVLSANENFCKALGYAPSEIVGKQHSLFVDPDYARGADYKEFWVKLGRGEFDVREYKRIAKGGREVWIQASYNPVKGAGGRILKVVKVATDVTAQKLRNFDFEGKINAISRSQAVIEFTPDGEIIDANEMFLAVLGYRLDEIKGKRHRMFVEPEHANSPEYQDFWKKLIGGGYISGEFHRIGKGGKDVWIQASYNPIFDPDHRVVKIVKFASDVTDRVLAVKEIGSALTRLADNDLEHRIDKSFTPAFEVLKSNFNVSSERLAATLRQVAQAAEAITAGSAEISAASDDLSRRTEQQAASLEETAAALEQVTVTVRKTADGAKQARDVVAQTRVDAEHSGSVVNSTVEAMGKIEKSSQEISQIIGVIDEIAFQTNLLALNAGVEAARAGEAGRGFAVVASEVRALAQRAADAAKQIKTLIGASNNQVGHGVKLVAATGESLARIAGRVDEIISVVNDIAMGAQEQATALQEVNVAVNEMDQSTQQNAAMAEQSTAAGQTLTKETAKLSELVSQFRIGAGASSGAIRRELEKVAPHAFRTPVQAPPPAARTPTRPSAAQPARPQQRKRASAAPAAREDDGWSEF